MISLLREANAEAASVMLHVEMNKKNPTAEEVGAALAELVRKSPLSREEIASKTGVSSANQSRYYSARTDPRLSTVLKILEVVEGDLEDLHVEISGTPSDSSFSQTVAWIREQAEAQQSQLERRNKQLLEDCEDLSNTASQFVDALLTETGVLEQKERSAVAARAVARVKAIQSVEKVEAEDSGGLRGLIAKFTRR